uniref:Uncharacterized protein n=1 Tax=Aegilops tauschii subsp. strangulata TaxID=200361 RepID=A0A453R7N6_AEGTS
GWQLQAFGASPLETAKAELVTSIGENSQLLPYGQIRPSSTAVFVLICPQIPLSCP